MKKANSNRKPTLLFDGILLVALLLVGLSAFLIFRGSGGGRAVRVTKADTVLLTVSLDTDGEYVLNGGSNILCVRDGTAYVREATCPDGLCIRMGAVRRVGEKIICLPNRICIEVIGDGEEVLFLSGNAEVIG